ncbi:MAG: hypothetical protein KAH22_04725 [Thiotrichaceae bacterium]|nr:hypothetical protein [Thiotrichaceae bacterium]
MCQFLAADLDDFKRNFHSQLETMLSSDQLGAFILVLANSLQDSTLQHHLNPAIKQRYAVLESSLIEAAKDDVHVFEQLKTCDLDALSCWQTTTISPWQLVYNSLRSMRPARASEQPFTGIYQDFNPEGFHFNKSFLKPEIFWEGNHENIHCRVLYNKFPFAPWHLLIVPEPEQQHPQYLNQDKHDYIMQLAIHSDHLTGFAMGYNSLGAYASINQLHFQGFIRESPLPIENKQWLHCGGDKAYPLDCSFYPKSEDSWQKISELHRGNQPYNLLYTEQGCYVIPQRGQQNTTKGTLGNIAWYEACGVFTTGEQAQLTIPAQDIKQTLASYR